MVCLIIRASARKHGVADEDLLQSARWPHFIAWLDDQSDPRRQLRLGFDSKGRLLEIVVLLWDDGTEEVIHAMKARKQYLEFF